MKTLFALAVVLASMGRVLAQNLVPNGSFEEYTTCPDFFGQVERCLGWFNLGAAQSADYFNACAEGGFPDVPQSAVAWQLAKDGQAYMGAATFLWQAYYYREFFGAQLTQPLQSGVPVHICFSVSAGGFGADYWNSPRWASKNIGVRFYMEDPGYWSYQNQPYENSAAVRYEAVLTDTADWVTVSGDYVPDSAYSWIVIGNFYDDSLSGPALFDDDGGWEVAYALVDDVSVTTDLNYCGSTGVAQMGHGIGSLKVVPDGSGSIRVVVPVDGVYNLTLLDITGNVVMSSTIASQGRMVIMQMKDTSSGIYVVRAELHNNLYTSAPLAIITP